MTKNVSELLYSQCQKLKSEAMLSNQHKYPELRIQNCRKNPCPNQLVSLFYSTLQYTLYGYTFMWVQSLGWISVTVWWVLSFSKICNRKQTKKITVPKQSERSSHSINLNVTNQDFVQVFLYWIDFEGTLVHQKTLAPFGQVSIQSYTGHVFVGLQQEYDCHFYHVDDQDVLFAFMAKEQGDHELQIHFHQGVVRTVTSFESWDQELAAFLPTRLEYQRREIRGFQVLTDTKLRYRLSRVLEILDQDLESIQSRIPEQHYQSLAQCTEIIFNRRIAFGQDFQELVEGRLACYHSKDDSSWLLEHQFPESRRGCVEIYSCQDYLDQRELWGTGGLLLHELCHAFHDKICPRGFENSTCLEAFKNANSLKIYDSVEYKSSQGERRRARAYAVENHKEYFAEISVAYMEHGFLEFNKWFPYNRRQLKEFDPQGFEMCTELWKSN